MEQSSWEVQQEGVGELQLLVGTKKMKLLSLSQLSKQRLAKSFDFTSPVKFVSPPSVLISQCFGRAVTGDEWETGLVLCLQGFQQDELALDTTPLFVGISVALLRLQAVKQQSAFQDLVKHRSVCTNCSQRLFHTFTILASPYWQPVSSMFAQ